MGRTHQLGGLGGESHAVHEGDGIGWKEPVQVLGAGVVRVEEVLVRLGLLLQDLRVALPEELAQPGGVHGAGGERPPVAEGHPGEQLGDGQHVLAGQHRLQGQERVGVFVRQLPVVQPCKETDDELL